MIAVDFVTDFSPNPIAEPNTSNGELLRQLETHKITLALATSRRGLKNQVNGEAIVETLEETARHDRLLPVGTLDPRRYVGWRGDLDICVGGVVVPSVLRLAIRTGRRTHCSLSRCWKQ